MAKYGYARVSSEDQNLDIQLEDLKRVGCDIIRSEKVSAASLDNREELKILLSFLRQGDELWVTRVDRLARSINDLSTLVEDLKRRGVVLKATQQPIDASSPAGSAFLSMLGVFAQFENEIRRERQMAGIAKAKAAGKYVGKGRPAIKLDKQALKAAIETVGAAAAARQFGISRATAYRAAA